MSCRPRHRSPSLLKYSPRRASRFRNSPLSPVASTRPRHWRGVSARTITRRPSRVTKSRPNVPKTWLPNRPRGSASSTASPTKPRCPATARPTSDRLSPTSWPPPVSLRSRPAAGMAAGRGDELRDLLLARRLAHIDRDRALALVEAGPVQAASTMERPAADVDTTAGRIDADDVGAHRRQRRAAERRGDECRDLHDAQPVQDAHAHGHVMLTGTCAPT